MKLSQGKDGIPLVQSTIQRDALFPTPPVNQRVQNLESGLIERYTGAEWLGVNTGGVSIFDPARDFGAVGDDSTNDTTRLQAAIDAAGSASPAGVVVINRAYKVSATANTVPGASGNYALLVPSGVTILGSAQGQIRCDTDGATVIAAAGASATDHVTDVTIQGVKVVGGDTTDNFIGRGIYLFRASRCRVIDNDIRAVRVGVQVDRSTSDSTHYNQQIILSRNIVRDTVGTSSGNGTALFASGVDGFVIADNICTNIAEHGIYINQDALNGAVTGNVLQPNGSANLNCGIQVFTDAAVPNISSLTITGNTVKNGKWGILVSSANASDPKILGISITANTVTGTLTDGIITSNVQECAIVANRVTGCTAGSGIEVVKGRSVAVTGNIASANAAYGILVNTSPDVIVSGNHCLNNDQIGGGNAGIRLANASTGHKLLHNICTDYQVSKTQDYGIQVDAAASGGMIHGNTLTGNATGAMQLASTGNTVKDNLGYNPGGPSAITVGASPFTYTAGETAEEVYIYGGTVSNVTREGTSVATASPARIHLEPGRALIVTYSGLPTMVKDAT